MFRLPLQNCLRWEFLYVSLDQWFSTGDIFGCTIKWMAGMLLACNRGMLLNILNTQDSGHIKKLTWLHMFNSAKVKIPWSR